MKPRFKPIYLPIIPKGTHILINNGSQEIELADPDHQVQDLIDLMDGSRDIGQLSTTLGIEITAIQEVIDFFDQQGLLEDADHDSHISKEDKQRYKSNLNYLSHFSRLDRPVSTTLDQLKKQHITALGLGGMSISLANLVGMGVQTITGVDYDRVELGNLSRQFLFTEAQCGQLKTDATYQQLKGYNQHLNFKVWDKKLQSLADFQEAISPDTTLVLNGVDEPNLSSTRLVNAVCSQLQIPYIQAGVFADQLILQVINPNVSGCYDCYLLTQLQDKPNFVYYLSALVGINPQNQNTAFAPYTSIASGLVSEAVMRYCLFEPDMTSYITTFQTNPFDKKAQTVIEKHPKCPTCQGEGLVELAELYGLVGKQYETVKQ